MVKNHSWRRKSGIIITVILLIMVVRIALPYAALRYVTSEISQKTEYYAKISDLNLYLFQGKSVLTNMRLWKKDLKFKDPYLKVDRISFSIHWSALLKGKLVGKINIQHPIITIIDTSAPGKKKQQIQISEQSIKIFKSLMPLDINQTIVNNGEVYFKNNQVRNPFNIYLKNLNMTLKNMQNIGRKTGLVSTLSLKCKIMDNADFVIQGKFNPSIKTPTFYVQASLEELELPKINSFLKKYTNVKTKSGSFSLFFEAAAASGKIKGYAKPFVKNLQIEEEKNANLGQKIYEGAISIAYKILKNNEQKSTATQINISGKIDDPNISLFSIIGNLLYHGFIQALIPSVDNKISMEDINYPKLSPHD